MFVLLGCLHAFVQFVVLPILMVLLPILAYCRRQDAARSFGVAAVVGAALGGAIGLAVAVLLLRAGEGGDPVLVVFMPGGALLGAAIGAIVGVIAFRMHLGIPVRSVAGSGRNRFVLDSAKKDAINASLRVFGILCLVWILVQVFGTGLWFIVMHYERVARNKPQPLEESLPQYQFDASRPFDKLLLKTAG